MRGIRLTTDQRDHLLSVYETQGWRAAGPLAKEYGVKLDHISRMAKAKNGPYYEVRIAKAKTLIREMIAEFKIAESDLLRSHFPEHAEARGIAIRRLKFAGFGKTTISKAMGIAMSTVDYWVYPKSRARRTAESKARYVRRTAA